MKHASSNRFWLVAGWVFLALAAVGLALPIIPQVPFAIVAAWCFSKGSRRMHLWMLRHKQLGPPIRDWENHRVVRPKLKAMSCVMMLVGGSLSFVKHHRDYPVANGVITAAFLASIVFVVTRRSRPRAPSTRT
jgi:uncharacterized membrane protein YbaN (DUF454 family)